MQMLQWQWRDLGALSHTQSTGWNHRANTRHIPFSGADRWVRRQHKCRRADGHLAACSAQQSLHSALYPRHSTWFCKVFRRLVPQPPILGPGAPLGAVGRCARWFSFGKAWHEEGLPLVWDPGSISRSHLNPFYHLKPVTSPIGCDGFCCEDFPSETVFPVGQCPAA